MKEITGKQKTKSSSLPKAIKTKQGITEKKIKIAKEFNKYLTSVGTTIASKNPIVSKDVGEYLSKCNASIVHKELFFQEFGKEFKMLKGNKATGCDGLNGNFENYRPISVLPIFSKILESIMYNRSYEYFMNNNLLHENQFGFQ